MTHEARFALATIGRLLGLDAMVETAVDMSPGLRAALEATSDAAAKRALILPAAKTCEHIWNVERGGG